MSFAKESWPLVLPLAALAILLLLWGHSGLALTATLIGLCVLLFFRIPSRRFEGSDGGVASPANGKILRIDRVEAADIGPGSFHRIIVFLSLLNVHVQRAPIDGSVRSSRYAAGRKLAAFDARAGEVNEQQLTVLENEHGELVGVRQIAGLLARRVKTYLAVGQTVERGALMGVIKFGSRVDLLLPASYELKVSAGQRVREGETLMAERRDES